MSGRGRRAVIAGAAVILMLTGVALATPVPVLALSDGSHEVIAPLGDGEALTYSYRQSIYDVPVYEEFVRRGDVIDLLRVRSPDIRSIEYFHWDEDPAKDADGLWAAPAPSNEHADLVLRIAPQGQQRLTTASMSYALLPMFGETVVTVRVERRPYAQTLLERTR